MTDYYGYRAEGYAKTYAAGLYLSGGAGNTDHDLSLGGTCSSEEVWPTRYQWEGDPLPGIVLRAPPRTFAGLGAGDLPQRETIRINVDVDNPDQITWEATDRGLADDYVVAEIPNNGKVYGIYRSDKSSVGLVLSREAGLPWLPGDYYLKVLRPMNNAFSGKNLTPAQASAGSVTYRCVFVKAREKVKNLLVWVGQNFLPSGCSIEVASETPVASTVQQLGNEKAAPSGVVFKLASTLGTALVGPSEMDPEDTWAVWIRRTTPPGVPVTPLGGTSFILRFDAL